MITKCTINDVRSIAELWETCFTDNKEIISNYLNNCFPYSETYGYIINNKIVSCITLIPCHYYVDNQIIYGKYLFGVCTDPKYRGKNLSKQIFDYYLTTFSEKDDYIFTHPAEESLYKIYTKWGFNTELYSINYELNELYSEEHIAFDPSIPESTSSIILELIDNITSSNTDHNLDHNIDYNINHKIAHNINHISSTKFDYNLSDTSNLLIEKRIDSDISNNKTQHLQVHKNNNTSYYIHKIADLNKHNKDNILLKIQKLRAENKKVFHFSNEILLYFLQDLILNNNHIYISDNIYAFYSRSQSKINIIEAHPTINAFLNRESQAETNKDAQINKFKNTRTESKPERISVKFTNSTTKKLINGLAYALNNQLDKSTLPYITLTGE